jgi:hypothetical protein
MAALKKCGKLKKVWPYVYLEGGEELDARQVGGALGQLFQQLGIRAEERAHGGV